MNFLKIINPSFLKRYPPSSECMTTYTGRDVYPMAKNQSVNEYVLEDVAHPLSRITRFNGHVEGEYTVGYHALMVCCVVQRLGGSALTQLQALHHDDSEAFMCDIPSPVKRLFAGYKKSEDRVQREIMKQLGIPFPSKEQYKMIKSADVMVLHNEALKLTKHHQWADESFNLDWLVFPYVPKNQIKEMFKVTHDLLMQQCVEEGYI